MLKDIIDERLLDECSRCNGSGQICSACPENVDNCECSETGDTWIDCPDCNGEGVEENGLEICADCNETDCICGEAE